MNFGKGTMLKPGFYAVEKAQLQRICASFDIEIMSLLRFLRTLKSNQPLPQKVLVKGMDRMLYKVYQLHGEGGKGTEAVRKVVRVLSRSLYNAQTRPRLLQKAPVVIFVLEYVEHGKHWWAGIRHRQTNQPLELFRLEDFFPHEPSLEQIGEIVCYSHF